MGGKTHLYRWSSALFFVLGVIALGLQLAGVMLPFWVKADWESVAHSAVGMVSHPPIIIYQGLWTNYECKDAYYENGDIVTRDCSIRLQDLGNEQVSYIPPQLTMRVVEVMSLGFGLLSVIGVIFLYVTAQHNSCKRLTSQIIFSACSLPAGFLAMFGVLKLTADMDFHSLGWGMVFPTVAGMLWLGNGAFSFVVCRYNPVWSGKGPAQAPILMHTMREVQ